MGVVTVLLIQQIKETSLCTFWQDMAAPGTLDRYAFRQRRTRSPEAQDAVKSKIKPQALQKGLDVGLLYNSVCV